MHGSSREHFKLVELADELNVAERSPPGPHFFSFPGGLINGDSVSSLGPKFEKDHLFQEFRNQEMQRTNDSSGIN